MRVARVAVAVLAAAAAVVAADVIVVVGGRDVSSGATPPSSMGTDGSDKEASVVVPPLASLPLPAPAPAPPPSPPLTPVETAIEDAITPLLPSPAISTNPSPSAFVNLATWLWIDRALWQPISEPVTVPGPFTIVVTAVPTQVLEQQVWETEAGERRSRVEVTADEVGPSLRFATVEISRNERNGDGDGESAGRRGAGTADVLGAEA